MWTTCLRATGLIFLKFLIFNNYKYTLYILYIRHFKVEILLINIIQFPYENSSEFPCSIRRSNISDTSFRFNTTGLKLGSKHKILQASNNLKIIINILLVFWSITIN